MDYLTKPQSYSYFDQSYCLQFYFLVIHRILYYCSGGSLTVQILGFFPSKYGEDGSIDVKLDMAKLSVKRKVLSTSPIIFSSRKDVFDLLK